MLETVDQNQKYKRIRKEKMYHRINESIDSMPNRTESEFVEFELLTVVDNTRNSIGELDISI